MRKDEIRSLIKNLLPKYDRVDKYHDRIVESAIDFVRELKLNEVFSRDPLELQRYVRGYGYSTAVAVLTESATGLDYSTLPAMILPFPDKASGVRRISTLVQGGITFYPMDSREMDLVMGGSYVDSVTGKIGYVVTSRIEYYNMSVAIRNTGVRMDLIVPFSVYADTDTVLIPGLLDNGGKDFIDKVLEKLGVIQPVDLEDSNLEATNKTNK